MAGDWIKMRKELADDPAVISIASSTGLDDYGVVGRLHKLWAWADSQTVDGNASCVTGALAFAWIDRYVLREKFAEAMISVGWLTVDESGIHFPNFERHNGEPAKQRALAANRSNKKRNANRNAKRNATTVTREEKRREEISSPNGEDIGHSRSGRFVRPTLEEVATYCRERKNTIDPQYFIDYHEARDWKFKTGQPMKDWRAAIRTWERNSFQQSSAKQTPEPIVYRK